MSVTKRIVVLANSEKHLGRCVAGLEWPAGSVWVRPVSERQYEELSLDEQRCEDGQDSGLLDVVELSLVAPTPSGHQLENWRIDQTPGWRRVDRAAWADVAKLALTSGTLWMNGYSSKYGKNNQIPASEISAIKDSLRLIRVPNLMVKVWVPWDRKRIDGVFSFGGTQYQLSLTDPAVEAIYGNEKGEHYLGECCVTISLGELFDGNHYKLIAGVMQKDV